MALYIPDLTRLLQGSFKGHMYIPPLLFKADKLNEICKTLYEINKNIYKEFGMSTYVI